MVDSEMRLSPGTAVLSRTETPPITELPADSSVSAGPFLDTVCKVCVSAMAKLLGDSGVFTGVVIVVVTEV